MSRAAVALAAIVVGCGVLAAALAQGGMTPPVPEYRACPSAQLTSLVSQVNEVRRRAGVQVLSIDAQLTGAARGRAAALAERGTLSHRGWERALREAGAHGRGFGENIAYNYGSASEVMRSWLTSSGHRANIMNPRFRRIGVGCVIDRHGERWWVQNFAA